jgi:hypothetical protein
MEARLIRRFCHAKNCLEFAWTQQQEAAQRGLTQINDTGSDIKVWKKPFDASCQRRKWKWWEPRGLKFRFLSRRFPPPLGPESLLPSSSRFFFAVPVFDFLPVLISTRSAHHDPLIEPTQMSLLQQVLYSWSFAHYISFRLAFGGINSVDVKPICAPLQAKAFCFRVLGFVEVSTWAANGDLNNNIASFVMDYCEAVWRQTSESFIRCLENAFRHFGGVTVTVVIDNLKAGVTMLTLPAIVGSNVAVMNPLNRS